MAVHFFTDAISYVLVSLLTQVISWTGQDCEEDMMSAEHEHPPRQKPTGDSGYFEKLTQAVFQTGFSWKVVRNKWPNFQRAFDGFDIDTVAAYDERDVDRLLADEGIVRNGRKIRGTIENAQVMQQLIAEHGSFHAYLRTLDGLQWKKRRKTLGDAFRYFGPTGVYFLLWSVGEEVPPWEERDK